MKKHWPRLLSAILTVVLLLQIAPLQAFAAADTGTADDGSGALLSGTETVPAADVVGEVESLRTEEGKHFRLSDGSYLAVSYGTPVHYQDASGRWQEIDNTLTFRPDTDSYATAQSGDAFTAFSADLADGHLATAVSGDTSVSMGLLRNARLQALLPAAEAANLPDYQEETAAEPEAETATQQPPSEDGWTAESLMPRTLTASVLYRDVYPGVDLRYTASGYNLKEQIILREKQDFYRYDFLLTLEGLTASLQENGSVLLQNAAGETVYRIPAPYLEDARGVTSDAVSFSLTETDDGTVLTVTADPAWMERASYPVTIDPTLISEVRRSAMSRSADLYATYVIQDTPNSTQGDYQDLYLGYGSYGKEHWGFFHVKTLPTVPDGAVVTGAALNLYVYAASAYQWGYSAVDCPELPLELCEVTGANTDPDNDYYDWLYEMSWNNKPAVKTGDVMDYTTVSAASQGSYVRWDMTRAVKKWYAEGTENRTVAILPGDRGTYDESHCALVKAMAYSQYYTPVFAVAYRSTTGIEPYDTYQTLGAGLAGSAYLADATGQLKVMRNAASYASTVNPVSVNLVYNSDYFTGRTSTYLPNGSAMDFGSGWTLDCVQKLAAQTIGGTEYLRYTDGDGTEHYFRKDSSKSADHFYDEDGLGLKIKAVSGGYEMSDDKDNQYTFRDGYLQAVTDANGNQILMTYSGGRLTAVTQKNSGGSSITAAALTYSGSGDMTGSVLYKFGKAIEPVTKFFGMGWQTFLAFVSSMISKEAVLGVTSVLFTGAGSIWEATATGAADANIGQIIAASISKPEALAFILAVNFNVPCLMALNATLHETHSAKWTVRIALYYIATALIISCLTYHIAGLFF